MTAHGSPMGAVRRPTPHRVVVAAGGDAGAVGAERHARDSVVVAAQRLADRVPGRAFHNRAVLSALPEAMRVPSGLNATLVTAVVVAANGSPWAARRRVPQPHRVVQLPEAMRVPSGLNASWSPPGRGRAVAPRSAVPTSNPIA